MPLLRRGLVVLTAAAWVWAAGVQLTGGFWFRIGSLNVSSRRPSIPVALGALLAAAAIVAALRPAGLAGARVEWAWWRSQARSAIARLRRDGLRCCRIAVPVAVALAAITFDVHRWAAAAPLWLDEESIAINVRNRGFAALAGPLWLGQSAPLGWLAAERIALLVFGTGEHALRLMPLLWGVATLAAALWIGRRWLGTVGATVLMLSCAFGESLGHYRSEVKPYTADAFWALLLPALVVWAGEASTSSARLRRALLWWAAAAVGLWLANGALLAAPGCAFVLLVASWRRDGSRAAAIVAACGALWLAACGLHDVLSLQFTRHSEFLHGFWAAQLPPDGMGPIGRVAWAWDRLQPLALDPGGTTLWVSLWVAALGGFVVGRTLGLSFATAPVSGLALGAMGLVPLQGRLFLWAVPALYVGVALLADRAAAEWLAAYRRRRWISVALAVVVLGAVGRLGEDIYAHGRSETESLEWPTTNHDLDDRAAVAWLTGRERGDGADAVLTTHLVWPAVWWYGRLPLMDGSPATRGRLPDGGWAYEVTVATSGSDCRDGDRWPDAVTEGRVRRMLVYLGFDAPETVGDIIMTRLERLGPVESYMEFGHSRVAVIDVDARAATTRAAGKGPASDATEADARLSSTSSGVAGCIAVQPALRW